MEAKKNSKIPPRYSEDTKKKCIELALKGMNVEEIVKAVKGPKHRAIMRYLRHAEVEFKR